MPWCTRRMGPLFYTSLDRSELSADRGLGPLRLGCHAQELGGTSVLGAVPVVWDTVTGASLRWWYVEHVRHRGVRLDADVCRSQSYTMNVQCNPLIATTPLDWWNGRDGLRRHHRRVWWDEPLRLDGHGRRALRRPEPRGLHIDHGACGGHADDRRNLLVHGSDHRRGYGIRGTVVPDRAWLGPEDHDYRLHSPAARSVVCQYGTPGLDDGDSCTLNLLNGETIVDTSTQTTGASSSNGDVHGPFAMTHVRGGWGLRNGGH